MTEEIKLDDKEVHLIRKKAQQQQALQSQLEQVNQDLVDAFQQLCFFKDVDPESYQLKMPDENHGYWRLEEARPAEMTVAPDEFTDA